MKIELKPGESIQIEFEETDGQFTVEFNETSIIVKESAGLDGSIKGGANEVLYQENFGEEADNMTADGLKMMVGEIVFVLFDNGITATVRIIAFGVEGSGFFLGQSTNDAGTNTSQPYKLKDTFSTWEATQANLPKEQDFLPTF